MIRRRQVHPDEILTLRDGTEVQAVSEEAFLSELLNVGRMLSFAGGTMSAVVRRQPTDLPGEMVTVGAVIEWKDRTDARDQPEPVATSAGQMNVRMENNTFDGVPQAPSAAETLAEIDHAIEQAPQEIEQDRAEDAIAYEDGDYRPVGPVPGQSDENIGDGLTVDPNAEDESEIPEHLRG